jgi:hypothetical protein
VNTRPLRRCSERLRKSKLHTSDGTTSALGESHSWAAYWLLTLVESTAGGRKQAAKTFNIDNAVLRKLAELSSTRGALASARKVQAGQSPLSGAEESWLEAAVKRVIRQVEEHGSGSPVPKLSMSDLPPL